MYWVCDGFHQCTSELFSMYWVCDGFHQCISELFSIYWVCDGFHQCTDDSDEGMEAGQGCNLYPDSKCRYVFKLTNNQCNANLLLLPIKLKLETILL